MGSVPLAKREDDVIKGFIIFIDVPCEITEKKTYGVGVIFVVHEKVFDAGN